MPAPTTSALASPLLPIKNVLAPRATPHEPPWRKVEPPIYSVPSMPMSTRLQVDVARALKEKLNLWFNFYLDSSSSFYERVHVLS